MLKRTKEEIACSILIVGGIAVCIGGFFLAPLLVLGGAMIAGGLTLLANILHENDRLTINTNNYGSVNIPVMEIKKVPEVIKATPKEKIAALFAFKNRKYAMHHEESITEVSPKNKSLRLSEDILQELDKINKMFSTIDIELIEKVAAQYNLAQAREKNPIDNDSHPQA